MGGGELNECAVCEYLLIYLWYIYLLLTLSANSPTLEKMCFGCFHPLALMVEYFQGMFPTALHRNRLEVLCWVTIVLISCCPIGVFPCRMIAEGSKTVEYGDHQTKIPKNQVTTLGGVVGTQTRY